MGPCPVPPTDGGSSTVSRNPPAPTEQSQSPCHVATAEFVPSRSAAVVVVGRVGAVIVVLLIVVVVVVVVVPVVVPGRACHERGRARPDVLGSDRPGTGEHMLHRLQPAAVVAEALGLRRADPL